MVNAIDPPVAVPATQDLSLLDWRKTLEEAHGDGLPTGFVYERDVVRSEGTKMTIAAVRLPLASVVDVGTTALRTERGQFTKSGIYAEGWWCGRVTVAASMEQQ
jgi:hypothetical protein